MIKFVKNKPLQNFILSLILVMMLQFGNFRMHSSSQSLESLFKEGDSVKEKDKVWLLETCSFKKLKLKLALSLRESFRFEVSDGRITTDEVGKVKVEVFETLI